MYTGPFDRLSMNTEHQKYNIIEAFHAKKRNTSFKCMFRAKRKMAEFGTYLFIPFSPDDALRCRLHINKVSPIRQLLL